MQRRLGIAVDLAQWVTLRFELLLGVAGQGGYRATDAATWAKDLRARAPGPINDAMATHISTLGAGFSAGRSPMLPPDPNAIGDPIGRQPMFLEDFLDRNVGLFSSAG
jgi:hypothetical protein